MKYQIKDEADSSKEIEVTISLEKMQSFLEQAAQEISNQATIKGFRPGKAPLKVVQEMVGLERVWHEATHLAVNQTYFEIIEKEEIEAIALPDIDILTDKIEEPIIYKAIVPTIPQISLPDYKEKAKKVLAKKKDVVVDSKKLDEALEMIQKSRAKTIKVTRKSKVGDEIVISFQGKIDGVIQEGLKSEKAPIIIGDKRFIPGFEEELIDLEEGDKKSFILKVPFSEGEEKDVEFEIEVISVNERELPQLDDEFAKSLGEFKDLEELKTKIGENIKEEEERKATEARQVEIMESIIKEIETKMPEVIVNRELDNMLQEFKAQFKSFDDYLKEIKKTEEEIRGEWREQAEKRIKVSLVLREIAKKEEIKPSQEEVDQEVNNYLSHNKDVNRDQLASYFQDLIQNRKVFEFLESL